MTENGPVLGSGVFRELERRGDDLVARIRVCIDDLQKDPNDFRRGISRPDLDGWISTVHGAVWNSFPEGSRQRAWLRNAEAHYNSSVEQARSKDHPGTEIMKVESAYISGLLGVVRSGAMLEPKSGANPMVVNVSVGSNSGILNIASHLEQAVQSVQGSSALSPERKVEWASLISQLQQLLHRVPEGSRGDAELVSEIAASMGKELEKNSPRAGALRISGTGLIEAAKALSAVVPAAIDIAGQIAQFVTGPLG